MARALRMHCPMAALRASREEARIATPRRTSRRMKASVGGKNLDG
jgi:hypothetical protein